MLLSRRRTQRGKGGDALGKQTPTRTARPHPILRGGPSCRSHSLRRPRLLVTAPPRPLDALSIPLAGPASQTAGKPCLDTLAGTVPLTQARGGSLGSPWHGLEGFTRCRHPGSLATWTLRLLLRSEAILGTSWGWGAFSLPRGAS